MKIIKNLVDLVRARSEFDELIKKLGDKGPSSWKITWRRPGFINNLTIGTRVETNTGYVDIVLHSHSMGVRYFNKKTNTLGDYIEFEGRGMNGVKIHTLYENVSSGLGEPTMRDQKEGESNSAFGNRLATKGARSYDWRNP